MTAAAASSPRRLVEAIDYLLITTDDHEGATPAGFEGPVRLPKGIRIESLDPMLADRLLDAACLRGENWAPPRQFHAVHAYVRTVWSEGIEISGAIHRWDHESRLYPCAQLSRLIRDNQTSTEFAVQRLVRRDGTETLVPFDGYDSHVAYRLYPEERGWLDVDEARQLSRLLHAYWDDGQLPERVGRALRGVDSVTRERYLEDALPIAVAGFESLMKIGRNFARAQFVQRVPPLAAEFGVYLSPNRCKELYDDRSVLVHGGHVDLSKPRALDDFGEGFVSLQEVLRRVVRKAIEDRDFASVFAEDDHIRSRWPVVVREGGRERAI